MKPSPSLAPGSQYEISNLTIQGSNSRRTISPNSKSSDPKVPNPQVTDSPLPDTELPNPQNPDSQIPHPPSSRPKSPPPSHKNPIGLSPEDPSSEAVRKFLRYHYDRMTSQEAGCLAGQDIEAVHAMRVATRRMRSVLGLFKFLYEKKAIRPHLRRLRTAARALGDVRDLDVMLEKLGHYLVKKSPKTQENMLPVIHTFQARRQAAHDRLVAYLSGEEYQGMKSSLLEFLETPFAGVAEATTTIKNAEEPSGPNIVRHLAPIMLYTQLGHTQAYQELLPGGKPETYHALRIEFKKLRYMMEFFSELLGPPAIPLIARIKVIQEHLGDLNDAEVVRKELWKILNHPEMRADPEHPLTAPQITAIGQYIVFREKEKARLIQTFDKKWKSFDSQAFRRTLANCIGHL